MDIEYPLVLDCGSVKTQIPHLELWEIVMIVLFLLLCDILQAEPQLGRIICRLIDDNNNGLLQPLYAGDFDH